MSHRHFDRRNYKIRGANTARKRRQGGGSAGDKTTFKPSVLIVYCPECPHSMLDPQMDVHFGATARGKTMKCPKGHVFVTR